MIKLTLQEIADIVGGELENISAGTATSAVPVIDSREAKPGTFEAWGRSPENPVGGWYGLKKGLRGRFGVYVPPLLEALGLVEITHDPKNNRIRAK
jgi:hypothetical protein